MGFVQSMGIRGLCRQDKELADIVKGERGKDVGNIAHGHGILVTGVQTFAWRQLLSVFNSGCNFESWVANLPPQKAICPASITRELSSAKQPRRNHNHPGQPLPVDRPAGPDRITFQKRL